MAAALAVALLLAWTSLSAPLARDARDVQLRLLAPASPSTRVVVFDIDDASLAELRPLFGTWPFKRDVYALVVEQLRDLGARAIAIDLLLADGAEGDASLARVLSRPGAPVVLAAAGLRHASDARRAAPGAAKPAVPAGAAGAPPTRPAPYAWPSLALPAPSVWPGAGPPRLGVITSPLDTDGVLRSLPLWHQDALQTLPVMPWAVHAAAEAAAPSSPPSAALPVTPTAVPSALQSAALAAVRPAVRVDEPASPPLDEQGAYHLAMPAAHALPPVRRFAELAQVALGQGDAAALRQAVQGRIVYLGSSALLADAVMTTQGQLSGTVALAQATAALGDGTWVQPPSRALDGLLVLMALLPAALPVWRGRPAPPRDLAGAALALAVIVGVVAWALLQWRQPTEWVTPLATLATVCAASLFVHHRGQAAARQRLMHELDVSEEAARAKSAFLANVSHEIRTPLNALLGVAELLSQTELTARQRLHVQVFRESGQALLALVNDLLDLSRIEAGRFELNPAPFDLPRTLAQLADLMRVRAEDKGLNLVLDIAQGLPVGVLGDRLRLEQALMNLVGNAVKFTARGSVRLAALPDPQVPGMLRFDVIDTGIGIAADKLQAIFEPFAQADGSITRLYGGTGLGLSITRSIAHLMGGSLQVQSAPGVGSTFTLRLPLRSAELALASADGAPPQSAPARDGTFGADPSSPARAAVPPGVSEPGEKAPAAEETTTRQPPEQPVRGPAGARVAAPAIPGQAGPAAGAPLSVLLAEDNEVNVYLFRNMLDGQPLELDFAADGVEALERLRRRRYDIAFIDVQMPGIDGLTVTRALRTLESGGGRARTPVVALTANAFASDVRASLEAGCDRHLTKPYSRAQLFEAIQQLAAPLAPSPTPAAAAHAQADSVLDRTGAIDRMGGDAALYQRLAGQAAAFMQEWPQAFERARAGGGREPAFRLAHDLRSIAASVGALAVAEAARRLEQSLRASHRPDASDDQTIAKASSPALDEAALQQTLAALPAVVAQLGEARSSSP